MVPFVVLFAVFAGLSLLPGMGIKQPALRSGRARMRVALGSMFLVTGISHFTATESFLSMVPDALPLRREAIYVSGVAELTGAAALFIPALRRLAGLGLAALLLAVLPANINVAVNNIQTELVPGSPIYQWGRLALQPVLVWFVAWAADLIPSGPRGNTPASIATSARVMARGLGR